MGLPVIATNWSGPTEYLTSDNGYPLPIEGLVPVREGAFKGHLWAEPSAVELRLLMRRVKDEPVEAKAKGRQARLDMVRRYSPSVLASQVQSLLAGIGAYSLSDEL